MPTRMSEIAVDAIRTDGGTQQRPIIHAVVQHYKELRQDGVGLPAIEVVSDGTDYWLWDGYHRLAAAKELKKATIQAHVTQGTQRDAVWLSYSANRAHGMPRPSGTAKRIIEQILCDPEWSQTALSKIAEHVGVSRQYVQQAKNDFISRTEGGNDDEEGEKNHTGDVENAEKGASTCTLRQVGIVQIPVRACTVKVQSRTGKIYEQQSQEKQAGSDAPVDADGVAIPEHLRPVFAAREQFQEFVQAVSVLKGQVRRAITANPQAFSQFNENAFRSATENIHSLLSLSGPFIVCSYCGGVESAKCRACKGSGFLNKAQSQCVPEEYRKAREAK